MGDQSGKPPLTRRVPGATRAGPEDPELRKPPELPESIRQRIQAVVDAAHAEAAREEAQAEQEQDQARVQGRRGRGMSSRRRSDAAATAGAANPPNRPVGWLPPTPTGWSPGAPPYQDAEFDTAPIPRPTASGAIASPDVQGSSPQPAQSPPRNGAARTDQPVRQDRGQARHGARGHGSEEERAAQERAKEERELLALLQRERLAAEEQSRKQKERGLRQERKQATKQARERAAQQKRTARDERERAEQERIRQEQERERTRLEQEREDREWAAMRRARLDRERAEADAARRLQELAELREQAAKQDRERAVTQQRERAQADAARRLQERAEQQERAASHDRERAEADAARRLQERAEQQERAASHDRERAEADAARRLQERARQDQLAEPGHGGGSERAAELRRAVQADPDVLAKRPIQAEPADPQRDAQAEPAAQPEPASPSQRPVRVAAASPTRREPRAEPRPLEAEAPRRRRYRGAALVAAAAVLVTAGWLVFERSPRAPVRTAAHPPKPTAVQLTKDTRNQAAAWIAQQVSSTAVVACDPVMCLALRAHGVRDLLVLEPTAADPRGSIVVATEAIRSQFGSRLASDYAPAVIASFGSGKARIDIRQAYPGGAAAYESALRTDLQNRKSFETTLAGNLQIAVSARARSQLTAGQVDARLGELMEGMSTYVPPPLDILSFGDLGPRASAGIPLRSATLTGSISTLRKARGFALAQTGELRPAHAALSTRAGHSVLVIEFSAPIPLGVFNPQSP
jgi:hypothetical protein